MLIKEFTDKYKLTADTIRFYEKIGLIHPKRLQNGYRFFDEECEKTIQLIIVLKQLEFSLDEIRFLLSLEKKPISSECNEATVRLFQDKIIQIENKMTFLQIAIQQLDQVKQLIENNQYQQNYHKIQRLVADIYRQLIKRG
ncbi:Transcriptional regulator, MarR family [[Clostridium] ultunense Esp]|uniref:Transcriptional regulator, MarR family n=1 Tax=[Clostridium] ultunense Esp TaxID=1288971 RepID=M1Z6G3_9FIRM|nr:MerR family transcriptional regulator [Schnuerera ultunensis]CCQ93168.1 Transcriptional regulator, MarR family [[Clostridium] ultunense Esp]SHD78450.1 Transcriptional regulator, MarR family [[Clostridium] ultunense Esp]